MGLFDGKAKKEAVENEIMQKLSQQKILNDLIFTLFEENEDWITTCQGYYDNRKRVVLVDTDYFGVFVMDHHIERDATGAERWVDDVISKVEYNYTSSGYAPLHHHVNEKGNEDVSVQRVLYLWASVIRERMQGKLPNCSFGEVEDQNGQIKFTYKVPGKVWKQWF